MRCYGNYLRDSLGDGRRPSEWNLFVALVDLLLYSRRSVSISGYAWWAAVGGRWEAEILFVVRSQHLHGALHRLCVCAHAIQRTHPAGIMTLLCLSCSANKMTIVHSVTSQHRTWTTHDTNDQRSKRQRYETIDTNVSPFRPNTKQHGMPTRNMI